MTGPSPPREKKGMSRAIKSWAVAAAVAVAALSGCIGLPMSPSHTATQQTSLTASFNQKSRSPYAVSAELLAKLVKSSASQFTVLGNTDHSDARLAAFLAREDTMEGLKAAGVRHLFLEIRHEFQGIADAVAAGKMTPEQYAAQKRALYAASGEELPAEFDVDAVVEAQIISVAGKQGIAVHCAERQAEGLKAHGQMVDSYYEALDAAHPLPEDGAAEGERGQKTLTDILTPLVRAETEKAVASSEALRQALEKRLAADKDIAAFVRAESGKDKAVVFYGAVHGRLKCDLEEHLRADRIEIYGDIYKARQSFQYMAMMRQDIAPLSIDLSQSRAITAQDAKTMLLEAPVLPARLAPDVCKAPGY